LAVTIKDIIFDLSNKNNMTQINTIVKHYHELNIIQKINVKANVRACIEKVCGYRNEGVYIAKNDLKTWQYDTPYYFSGSNSLY
jgi:hypothetical protein